MRFTTVNEPNDNDAREVFAEVLRQARRRNRIATLDKFDAFYKAYVTGLFSAIAIYVAAGWIGDAPIANETSKMIGNDGPGYLGLVAAFVVAIGLRSGGRGGPLAFEHADVRHVLLAPVDRSATIRKPALVMLRHGAATGAAIGGAAGLVALRRLPEAPVLWVLCGAFFGALVASAALGAAMVVGGRRAPAWFADVVGVAILAWSAFDVALHVSTSPLTWIGAIAIWPIDFDLVGLAGAAIALLLAFGGMRIVGGISIEAAERRSRLVGQLRFAATLQDVRTVMVLQRQLSQQHLRSRPRFRLPAPRSTRTRATTGIFVRRSLHDLLRWPGFRLARLLMLVALAAFSVCGVWAGTGVLIVPAGVALWLAALDLLEPLAQESDRPDRLRSFAHTAGWVMARHLVVPFVLLLVLLIAVAVPTLMLARDPDPLVALWPSVVLAAWLAVAGGALAVTRQPGVPTASIQTPEVAGLQMLWKAFAPPALAVLALMPLVFARRSWFEHHSLDKMLEAVNLPMAFVLAFGSWAVLWVRYGSEMRGKLMAMGAEATGGSEAANRVPKS